MSTDIPAKARFDARTLINIGVFTALYFVVMFGTGMLGLIAPGAQIVGFLVGSLVNGTIIMLFMVKARAFGSMTLLGTVVGLLMVLTGHFWATLVITPVLGLVADALIAWGGYRNRWMNIFGFALFQGWVIGPFLPIFLAPADYFAHIGSSMGQSYAHDMQLLFSPVMVVVVMVANMTVSILAGWVGTRILDKHFTRAGIL
ncbi:MptD family putative ECF transporter S component [Schaalia sp. 19OD2882]|uniref:MptD family putative ECF transporter S component n=1 Tax=Schaalia sp. 19OD2882 TaxID=2794089 RepID=UPI001C1F0DD2|nr:MptD family putative ECF transporter S component [Schaalia sp. 19OD2882]QWW19401.1 MptD family putative ECF transporter S component [Schaalia sp. 19OD2882]